MTTANSNDNSSNRMRTLRNAAWYLASGVGGHAYVLISLPLLNRLLTAEEFGAYVILAQVAMIVQMVMSALFGSAIFRLRIEHEGAAQRSFLSTIFATAIFGQVLIWLLLNWHGSEILTAVYPNLTLELGHVPQLLGAWMLLLTLRTLATTLVKSLEEPKRALQINLLYGFAILATLGFIFFAYPVIHATNANWTDVFWALIVAEAITAIAVFFLLRKHLSLSINIKHLHSAIRFTGPLVFGSIILSIVFNLDGIILARYVNLDVQGVYGFGSVLGKAAAAVSTAYISSYSVRLINSVGENRSTNEIKSFIHCILRDNFVLMASFCCFVFVCAEFAIGLTMVEERQDTGRFLSSGLAVWAFCTICLGHLSRSVFQVFYNTLFALKRSWFLLFANIGNLVAAVFVMIIAAELFGAAGVAMGLATSYLIACLFVAPSSYRFFQWTFPWRSAIRAFLLVGFSLLGTALIWELELLYKDPSFWVIKGFQVAILVSWWPALIGLKLAAQKPKVISGTVDGE